MVLRSIIQFFAQKNYAVSRLEEAINGQFSRKAIYANKNIVAIITNPAQIISVM